MSFLMGRHAANGLVRYNGIKVQSSIAGAAITIGWGLARTKCNLLWYGDFKSVAQKQKGGKGGGGGSVTSYSYYSSFIAGLCEGPIRGVRTVYLNSSVFSGGSALLQAGLGGVMLGTAGQSPWGYMTSAHPSEALGYSSTAYVYASNFSLGTSPTLPNFTFEVDFGIQGPGGSDANPKDIVTDYLTNVQYGLPGWSSAFNANWSDWSNYCLANNLLLSPVEETQRAARDFVSEMLLASNSDAAWSEGVLKIKPYGDAAATGNGVTWTPNLTPVYDFTEDDLIPIDGNPVQLEILDQAQAYNFVQVEYLNRATQYATEIAQAQDKANIDRYGRRSAGGATTIHSICDAQVGQQVAQILLQRSLYRRDVYTFALTCNTDILEPLDYVTLTTTTDGLLLNRQLVQITEITEDEQALKTIKGEGVLVGTANASLYSTHSGSGFAPNQDVAPGSVVSPVLFNPPTSLVAAGTEVWLAAGSSSPNWGGCEVWISADNVSYSKIGVVEAPGRYGVLTASLASHADPDTTNTLAVDLSACLGTLAAATAAEANAGGSLCLVGNELVTFQGASLTSANHYSLTSLRRGFLGTAPAAHSIGDRFVRLDQAIFKFSYTSPSVGGTTYVKLPSFNIFGRALEDISTVTAYTLNPAPATSLPEQATGLALAGGGSTWVGDTIYFVCNPSARATSYKFLIYRIDETTLLRTIVSATPTAAYGATDAAIDGVQRAYHVKVIASNAAGDAAASSWLSVTNAAPAAVSSPAIGGGTTAATATCSTSSDPDLSGYILFYSASSGFDPATVGGVVASGVPSITVFGLTAGTYYGKIGAIDAWSANPSFLNLSSEISFTITAGGGSSPSGGGGTAGGFKGRTLNGPIP